MTQLNEVFGLNPYCGPGVLSALTGKSTDHCAAVISAVSGAKIIKAVNMAHILEAAKRLGFEVQEIKPLGRTVYGTITGLSISGARDTRYIFSLPKHVVAVEITANREIYVIDNQSKKAVTAGNSARLSQNVLNVYQLIGKSKEEIAAQEAREKHAKYSKEVMFLEEQIAYYTKRRDAVLKAMKEL